MPPPDEPEDADALARLETPLPADDPIGPVARDALLREIARRLGPQELRAAGIEVPHERALAEATLQELARLDRGICDLAALATEGRSDVALMALARALTQS